MTNHILQSYIQEITTWHTIIWIWIFAPILAENMVKIRNKSIGYRVEEVTISSIIIKESIRLTSLFRKVNDKLSVLCYINKIHFISNDSITRKYLCWNGVHLTDAGVSILAGNIVNYLNTTIMFIVFWDFLMVEHIFLSPQVKRSMIIGNKLVYTSCLTSC